jgi:phosphatidylglycerophosphate synthase
VSSPPPSADEARSAPPSSEARYALVRVEEEIAAPEGQPGPAASFLLARPVEPMRTTMADWTLRMQEPLNRYYRYPIARLLVRALVPTRISPNHISLAQPPLAGLAGYLITFGDAGHLAAAGAVFELRSILDCVDGTLARARGTESATGHVIDAVADWLGVVLLYVGIFWCFRLHPPPLGTFGLFLPVSAVLVLALTQGGIRSLAADHYKRKYTLLLERGQRDPSARRSLEASAPLWRFVLSLWGASNGDAFLTVVTASLLLNQLWLGQVFFATIGVVWIAGVLALNGWFSRSVARLAVA